MELPLLHRDRSLAVIDKPAGLPVEADSDACVTAILARQLAPAGGRAWPRVVHRIDRDTSGCLAVALTKAAEEGMRHAFERGAVEKEYLALVLGAPPDDGNLDTPYGPDPRDRRRFTTRLETPRRARLAFRVRERLRGAALLEVRLLTGRTHQIRVQLAEAGFPLMGDATYGAPAPGGVELARTGLHAERLRFPHPAEDRELDCRAPLPADLGAALAALRR